MTSNGSRSASFPMRPRSNGVVRVAPLDLVPGDVVDLGPGERAHQRSMRTGAVTLGEWPRRAGPRSGWWGQ